MGGIEGEYGGGRGVLVAATVILPNIVSLEDRSVISNRECLGFVILFLFIFVASVLFFFSPFHFGKDDEMEQRLSIKIFLSFICLR